MRCWQDRQSSRRLSGVVEADTDAASLRKWKDENGSNIYLHLLGLQRTPDKPTFEEARQVHPYCLGVVSAKAGGKPPPESKERILRCEAMEDISLKANGRATSVRQFGLAHLACNHSQGEFNVVKRRRLFPTANRDLR